MGGLADRWGSPTFVGHLAERILPLVLTGRFGLYHLGGPQPASWFEVLTRVHGLIGFPGAGRAAARGRSRPAGAARPRVLGAHERVHDPPRHRSDAPLDEGLKDFVADALAAS